MANSLGIHLYSHGFDYVVLEGTVKRYSVSDSGSVYFSADDVIDVKSVAKRIAEISKGFKGNQICLSLSSSAVLNRELSLPFSNREKVAQVIKFEIESELYHLNIDDVLVDFFELDDGRATSTMSVNALSKTRMQSALEICEAASFDPPVVDLSIASLFNAIKSLPDSERQDQEAYLHVGAECSQLLVLSPGGLARATRTIPFGWLEMARNISSEGGDAIVDDSLADSDSDGQDADNDEDDALQLDLGGDTSIVFGMTFDEVLEQCSNADHHSFASSLEAELRRAMTALNYGDLPLYLLGAQIPGLAEDLSAGLNMQVAPVDLLMPAAEDLSPNTIAFGAALRAIGGETLEMNFRQEEFRYARGVERIEGPLTWAMVGLVFYFAFGMAIDVKLAQQKSADAAVVYARARQKVQRLNEQVNSIDDYPDDWVIKNDFSANDVPDEERIHLLMRSVSKATDSLDQLMGEAAVEMPQSCLEAWRLLMNHIEQEMSDYQGKWMIESFEFTSFNKSASEAAHVSVKFGITIYPDSSGQLIGRFDRLQRNLENAEFTLGQVEIPSTKPTSVPEAKTAIVEVDIIAINPNINKKS
ncbi:MAG: pilus assembly protein PilM [Planctomycetes bacterium]|nr:pilus assembly protein PilM [Planctomycetota bacterium]